jgi:antitoxin VapB
LQKYIPPYILHSMSSRAKLFQNGGSQAVRLPQSCRFPADQREVLIRREGRRVILEPVDEWPEAFRKCVGAWNDEIPRPPQSLPRDPFE